MVQQIVGPLFVCIIPIEMSGEAVLNEEGCEVEGPQHQLFQLLGLLPGLVTTKNLNKILLFT